MAIAFVNAGTNLGGTTSLNLAYPASLVVGNLVIATIVNKYPANAPATPVGWTAVANYRKQGGAGSSGIDSGQVFMSVYYRIVTGTEGATQTFTITSGNSSGGRMWQYSRGGTSWDIAATGGTYSSPSASWSSTMDADPGITSGDLVLTCCASNGDSITFSSPTLTAASATFAAGVNRGQHNYSNGQDCKQYINEFSCTAGTATAAAVYGHTNGSFAANTPAGAVVLFRLREISAASAPGLPFTYCT